MIDYQEELEQYQERIDELAKEKRYAELRDLFLPMEPADIALLLEEGKQEQMPLLYRLLPKETAAEGFVELEPESYAAVLDNLPLLQEFGFVCEDFGGGTVLIREVPADILAADAAVTLEELAQKLALGRADPNGARDELLHTMACKSAIKAGMTTDATELAALVEKVQSGEILYCPHGRPVKYQLSKYDIEKMFKRA